MTEFSALEQLVSDAIDGVFAESIRVIPMAKGGGDYNSRSEDTEREEIDAIGIIDYNPVVATVVDKGQYDGFQPAVAGEKIHVSFDMDQFQGVYLPRHRDVLVFVDRVGQPRVSISRDPEPDGIGRIVCFCVPA